MLQKDDLEHLALLSRLALDTEEKTRFTEQLSAIFDFVKQVQDIDTADVEPLHHVTGLETVWRDDEPREWPHREELLDAAPKRNGAYIETKSIL